MTRRSRLALTAVGILAAIGFCLATGDSALPGMTDPQTRASTDVPRARTIDPAFTAELAKTRRTGKLPFAGAQDGDDDGQVTIAGAVVDVHTGTPVPGVEVVFRNEAGEATVTAGADGRYAIHVARGSYHAFVRDDSVLSVGRPEGNRLPSLPSADVAGVPDEGLMPIVVASRDADAVDLSVVRGGTISGKVIDQRGTPIVGAVVRARGGAMRPALGTDVAETDAGGHFEMRLPAGGYAFEATHARFAGTTSTDRMTLEPGEKATTTVTMTAGCVIAGRVLDPRGKPAGDGAIEKQWGTTDLEYGPTGRIESDGTFRWVTTEETDVTLRAWPWKSPPSASRTFNCRDGARFTNVVFQLASRTPDIEGVLVDERGQPVPFAFVDFAPQDQGGIGQQERTDADGRWQVFNMPAGAYRATASAPGHGVTVADVQSPQHDITLTLGGTGRIEGTTTLLANGTFELADVQCADVMRGRNGISLTQQHRLVQVIGGHFTIDDVPACTILGRASWREQRVRFEVEVAAGASATVELDLGPPHAKTVHGTIRDDAGRPVPNALVTASYKQDANVNVRSDAAGRYTLQTFSGATINADALGNAGSSVVGMANVDDEEVDVSLGSSERPRNWED